MKPAQIARTIAQSAFEPFETLKSQVGMPMLEEAARELGFGSGFASRPRALAQEDLQRARNEKLLKEKKEEDAKLSQENAQKITAVIQKEYQLHQAKQNRQQEQLHDEMAELQAEIVKLAKTAGVETKAHLQNPTKKIGALDIKILTTIVRFLRIKAEEGKNAKELVMQRSNAKRPTGMLAWVSGKQMKVHEQGTLQLQG